MATVAELLLEQGRQQAQNRQRQGELQNATWQNLAQIAQQYGANVQKQQELAPQREMQGIQLQNARDQQRGNQVLDQALQPVTPQGPAEGGGNLPPQHPYLGADGLYDTARLQDAFAAQGVAHLAPEILKNVDALNDSVTKHKAAVQKAAESKTVLLGDLADTARKMHKQGTPLDQALDFAAQSGLTTGAIDPKEYQQARTQILSMPPEQQDQALGTLMDSAAKIGGGKTLAKDAVEYDRYGRPIGSNIVPDKPNESELALRAAQGDKDAIKAIGLLKPTPTHDIEGEIRETPTGFVRIVKGVAVPVTDASGKATPAYHPPQQPIVIQTSNGPELVNRGAGTATAIKEAGTGQAVQAPVAASVKLEESHKKNALNSLGQLDQAIEDAKDLIGPGAGRVSSLEQMVGNADPRIAALGTKMLLAKMQVDAGIGGARAAASPQLLARWDNLLANKVTPEGLKAAVQAMREIIGAGVAPSGAGNRPTMSAADLIKKYGGTP